MLEILGTFTGKEPALVCFCVLLVLTHFVLACNSIYLHQKQAHVWTMAKNERWQGCIHHKHTTRFSSFQATSSRAVLLEGISEFGKECKDCLTGNLCFVFSYLYERTVYRAARSK
jgi:hypothetical protein